MPRKAVTRDTIDAKEERKGMQGERRIFGG